MAFCELVQIQQNFIQRTRRIQPAAANRVLLALFRRGKIFIAAQAVRNRHVGLQNPPEHLLIELILKLLGGAENRVGVRIFCFEVRNNLWAFLLPQPIIVIHAAVAVQNGLDRFAARQRRSQSLGM